MELIKKLLLVSRPVSWLNTAFPFASAYLILGGSIDIHLVVGSIYFLFPYNLLMYGVNDVFDYESDMANPRKGGIEGAKFSRRLHRPILVSAALTNLLFLPYLIFLGSAWSAAVLVLVVFFVLAYSLPVLRFKERPFVDSVTSSAHFVGPLLYALSLFEFPPTAWPLVIAFFIWGVASHAFGAVQDIAADRKGGIASIATSIGAKHTVRFSVLLYSMACLVLFLVGWPAALIGAVGLAYVINAWPYLNVSDSSAPTTNLAWRRFIFLNLITGFVITLVLIVTAFQS
jgi:4-hydroxybenzoate polyprenyltransferase